MNYERALIIGAGPGVSGSFARAFSGAGGQVHLAARNTEKLGDIAAETGATTHVCDAADGAAIGALFAAVQGWLEQDWPFAAVRYIRTEYYAGAVDR